MPGLLSILIFLPVLAALVSLMVPSSKNIWVKHICLGANIIQVLILVIAIIQYNSDPAAIKLLEQASWFQIDLGTLGLFQAEYLLGADGLSLPLVILSVLIMLIATISSWHVTHHTKGYFILLLIQNAAIIGSFVALDILLFYLFFEFMLLPMFFLIGIWGGAKREYASIKFFLYTLLGSILILIVFIALYLSVSVPGLDGTVHTFNLFHLLHPENYIEHSFLHPSSQQTFWSLSFRSWAFLLVFIGFAIKLPMVPFHTWLPDAHVEASTPISVILAALLLKIGGYGLIRIVFPIFPDASVALGWFVGLFGVISILYGALNALSSKDLKRLIAYSSVSHMGFVLLGLASLTVEGVSGSIYQMVSHGIITAMLFLLAGVLYDRTQNRMIENYSGLIQKMPSYFVFVLIAFFASLGLPGFSGFIAEIFVFLGAFQSYPTLTIIATLGLILGAAYFLWTIQRMFFGTFHVKGGILETQITDLTKRELGILLPLAIATLTLGIVPQLLLNYLNPFVTDFVKQFLPSIQ